MTVDQSQQRTPQPRPARRGRHAVDQPAPDRVVDQYRASMRLWRVAYAVVIVVVVATIGVVVKLAYNHGEISHATLATVATPPPSIAPQTPAVTLATAWSSADATAIGTPYWKGTVVTFDGDSVRGRNAITGAITWSYTRDDRRVCTAAQIEGVTAAIFSLHGNCNEVTAVNSETGTRLWTRTLDKDGHLLTGRPTYQVTQYTLLMTTPSVIYAVDPVSGLDRWVYGTPGCSINRAVLGSTGALISQNCTAPDCTADSKFCGPGQQLLLRDATTGENDNTTGNHDQIKWNIIGSTLLPAAADSVVAAIDHDARHLLTLDSRSGKTLSRLSLAAAAGASVAAAATNTGVLIFTGGVSYFLRSDGTGFDWHAATATLPTITSLDQSSPPVVTNSIIAVTTATGIALLSATTGAATHTIAVPTPPVNSRAYPLGRGFILAGAATTVFR